MKTHIIRLAFISLLSLIFLSAGSPAQDDYDTNAKFKTMFIYNFSKYIEWPSSYKQGNFIIGVLGKTALQKELDNLAATKKAVTQKIEIRSFASVDAVQRCHMLLVPKTKSTSMEQVVKKMKGNSTLVISEQAGLAQKGSGINFIVQGSKLRFEMNKANIEKYNLKVSSSLESLAIMVN